MKVVNKSVFVNVQHDIVLGDGSIKATVEHQIITCKGENGVDVDVEFIDIPFISFLGLEIKGYKEFNKFKANMSGDFGIDVDELIDEECVGLISSEFIEKCKQDFIKIM